MIVYASSLESSLSTENLSWEVIRLTIAFKESTLKSAYFLKSPFFESFSNTVTGKKVYRETKSIIDKV